MSDIPAFTEEADMTSATNFLSAIYFELVDYTDLQNGAKHVMAKEWKDVDNELKHSEFLVACLNVKASLQIK